MSLVNMKFVEEEILVDVKFVREICHLKMIVHSSALLPKVSDW